MTTCCVGVSNWCLLHCRDVLIVARYQRSLIDLVGMVSVPLCFGKHERDHEERKSGQRHVEPPEVAPANMGSHSTGNDWSYHERSHVDDPVEGVPFPTIVEEEDVGNNSWLNALGRTGTETVEATHISGGGNVGEGCSYTQAPMKLP